MIMHEAASPETLDDYSGQVRRLYLAFGPKLWLLLYQSEVRCRLEEFERIRRRGVQEQALAAAAHMQHDFDVDQPWEWVFSQAIDSFTFWHTEFERNALLVRSEVDRLGDHLGLEVANVQSSAGGTGSPSNANKRTQNLPPAPALVGEMAKGKKVKARKVASQPTGLEAMPDSTMWPMATISPIAVVINFARLIRLASALLP